MNNIFRLVIVAMLLTSINFSVNAQSASYWNEISPADVQTSGNRVIIPSKFRTLTLNVPEIKNILITSPDEEKIQAKYSNTIISLPLPNGGFGRFRIVDSPVMEKGLADKFPEIRTFAGQGIDDPYATVRLDVTQFGFHAMIITLDNMIFIDPYALGDAYNYISYFKSDYHPAGKEFNCEVIDDGRTSKKDNTGKFNVHSEGQLRKYRIAIGATGEYTAYFGGTVSGGLAAIVTSLNRVDGVYEHEVAVRMVLVSNNNLIVYTNASTDPYTNNNGNTMLGQNQTTIDNVIGSANYDIGHVFSTGGGGVADLGCVCVPGYKAQGVTGSTAPVGDPYDIDYVAHEMGHQFGGNHTFNSTTGSCGGGNRAAGAAYEPGSGSTIMAYAGICSPNDLQPHSDAYFHSKSLDEILTYTTGSSGNNCPVITSTGNHNPVVTAGAGGNTIPISTPFTITGSATDSDNDTLSYCWEEYDLGPAGTWNAPSGNAPIFRSFNPVAVPSRTFPKQSSLLNNTQVIGEILPTYTRSISFCLIARDNKAGGGGVGFDYTSYNVTATAGPFLVTSPNTAVTWNANITQTVTWNVANTTAAPVSCANVNIKLSTDGGVTFPTMLKANTPNDGSESVTLPMTATTTARIKVEAADNIFFDISNTNFTISTVNGISNQSSEPISFMLAQNFPNPFNPTTMISFSIPQQSAVTLKVYDMTGKLIANLISNETRTEGTYSYEFDGSRLASGIYFYKLDAGKYSDIKKMILVK
ncbi:MAG: M12 family metallo-peptidase [Ignavibacteria bacterium]|nr:M12 family metallo-peptidase [Ignavibacteria bacterium]